MSPPDVPDTPRAGLSTQEAARRLVAHGPNVLPTARGPGRLRRFLRELLHFFAVLLWVAAALAVVAGLPELAVAIAAVVVANGAFAFVQEHRAERAAQRLRELLPRRSTVIRDGVRRSLDAADLVLGDLVALEAGDRVCADASLVEVNGLSLDSSMLTGESAAVRPGTGDAVHAGTFVLEGEGIAAVTATGAATRLAGIAALTTEGHRPPSPLAREMRRLVRTIATIAVGVGMAFFVVGVLLGTPLAEGFVFGIGVTVALVPEALLPTVTLTLALGAQRMAGRAALVRRLESVQTLGATTFVCTDKTGTLTMNQMAVVEAWTPAGTARIDGVGYEPEAEVEATDLACAALATATSVAARCSTGRAVRRGGAWVAEGDPMEAAIDVLARRLKIGPDAEETTDPTVRRFPFDPRRRRMSLQTRAWLLVKGAPDSVLARCAAPPRDAAAALAHMTVAGLRVLAVARRPATTAFDDPDEAERDLELLGLLGLADPPRPHAASAIASCRRAGICVAMITGDHPATALAVAHAVGLTSTSEVLTGAQLPVDEEELGRLVDRDGIVVARVTPEDKLRIARALQARRHVVAMTGDGVNDGPALRQADVGIAMGRSGTDIAREAADLVLLDDDFATIVAAVEDGRATFSNVRRFLTYHLTDNVAELAPFLVWALSAGRFPLALTVLQILALDLGTDTFSAVALGAEPPGRGLLERPPTTGRLLDGLVARRAFAILGPAEAVLGLTAFVVTLLAGGWRIGTPFPSSGLLLLQASGATFATVVLAQTANAFACRSTRRTVWQLDWASNRLLLVAVVVELGLSAIFLLVSPVAELLRHATPSWAGWAVALLAMVVLLLADATDKALRAGRDRGPSIPE